MATSGSIPKLGWAALVVALALPILVTPVVPLIDLYNHVARFYVLSHIDGDAFLTRNYAPNWHLLPNIGLDVPAVWLAHWIEPLLLAKLIVTVIVALQISGTLFLNRSLTGRINAWSALLAAALCYSFILSWGFLNYLLATGIALWTLGLWVRLRDRPVLATSVCAPLALLILFCHGFAFGLYGLVAGALEFGLWLNSADRRLVRLLRGGALLSAQAVAPLLFFLAMPTSHANTYKAPVGQLIANIYEEGNLATRLWLQIARRFEALIRVAETPWPWLDGLLFAATVLILVLAFRRKWLCTVSAALPALALALLLVVVMPGGMFGAGHLFERMPLLFALLFAASLQETAPGAAGGGRLKLALLAVTLVRFAALDAGWSLYRQQYANFERVTADLPAHAIVAPMLVFGENSRDGLFPRCQMFPPLTVIEKRAATPLFADPTQQPLLLKSDLKGIADVFRSATPAQQVAVSLSRLPFFYDDMLARIVAERHASHVLMCGAERLKRPLPATMRRIATAGNLSLYEIR
ncbi:hypothetical protein [Sphingomonas sp. dw_22]|uniref:hypothetical protein n=1 Tax=Sphingomonas sp. dw_22 TaxID=2721175 RepID=UPI001BD5F22B|nr:hypothetical protein [Sphingomonas sp. dw_22]